MKQYITILFSILIGATLFTSCESLTDVSPEEVLLSDDYLGDDKLDARSALFGVISQMQDITEQYIVLGEIRADLVDVTSNAGDEIRQINTHNINLENSYVDPKTLFSIINNCNFALAGIDTEAYDNLLLDDYASILRIRTWSQMQILINYGKLPYITDPIQNEDDLTKKYPLLSFEQGIDQLIENLQAVTGVDNVTDYENSLGFSIFNMIPNQDVLLGDLNLWKGNFPLAAMHYKQFLDDNVSGASNFYNLTSLYGVTTTESSGAYTTDNNWDDIFQETIQNSEVINYISYSEQFRQENNGFVVFGNQIKPSSQAIFLWDEQLKGFNKQPYESGDNRASVSYTGISDMARITKYQYDYFTWNRVAKIYLRYAEAINYAGYPYHALTIVNGIFNDPNTLPQMALIFNNTEDFLNFDVNQYYVTNSSDVPTSGNLGVRGRVSMAPVFIDSNVSNEEAIKLAGELILNEMALELAFEGNRWEDLVRFSKRANNPVIISEAVAQKFETSGDASSAAKVRAILMNPENWYLPLTLPENFVSD
ncbi:RagB/SusD family nutrient uptake outer membrane protein [uncultured Polaribacter sp.]|uniref:RagB/SusD family nutrient uptake outer membrane protein n=1 Tax=uncultured Polaribacter sp. TaxID=174711 RepID=UPI00263455B9|nr:RagB/SusD family nutrient uptake outer membrane protein [uncultured Polaribacter sp.]